MASSSEDQALLQGIRKVGLTGPPPGFSSAAPPNPPQQPQIEFDDRHLSSIFRLALEEDAVEGGSVPPYTTFQHLHPVPQEFQPPGDFGRHQQPFNQQVFMQQPQQQPMRGMPHPSMPSGAYGGPPPHQHFIGHAPPSQFNPQPPNAPFHFPPQQPMGYGMPPPRPGMPPPHPGMPPPFQAMPAMRPPQEQQNQLRFKDYERMKGREIAIIVRNQLKSVESGDDFSDDYYFIQNEERKRSKQQQSLHPQGAENSFSNEERPAELLKTLKAIRDRSTGGDAPRIVPPVGPLPDLPAQRAAHQEALEKKQKQRATAETKWAGANNVLGRTTKANLRTPRELIALHDSLINDGSRSSGNGPEPYATGGWKLRKITSEVADCLGQIQDITRHLKARASALPPGPPRPEWEFVHEKVRLLEAEQHAACERLAKEMGLIDADDAKLLSLLWLPRGRKIACKAARSLLPEHLLLFLEAAARMLVYFVCTSPDGKNSSSATEREKYDLDMFASGVLAKEYSEVDLEEATKCLRLFLGSQTPESLRAVIATPGGAEVSKTLLIHGQDLCESCTNDELKARWAEVFGGFISMAEEGISAKEGSGM